MSKETMKTGIELIAQERKEQIEKHGYTQELVEFHPEWYDNYQLAVCAEMLLAIDHEEGIDSAAYPDGWDEEKCSYMLSKPRKERLIIAGALIAAEIDRLNAINKFLS